MPTNVLSVRYLCSFFLLAIGVSGMNSAFADFAFDQLKVQNCATNYAGAQGLYSRTTNARGEWATYSNLPVYTFVNGAVTYRVYYQAHSMKWVMDNNAVDATNNGIIGSATTTGVEHPTLTSWSNNCLVLPNRITISHPTQTGANGVYTASGNNQGLPQYVKSTWRLYFHGTNKVWVLDKDALSNSNMTGVVAKGNANVKNPVLAIWNNGVTAVPYFDDVAHWHAPPSPISGDCTQIQTGGAWSAVSCATAQPFACFDYDSDQWKITQTEGTWFRGAYQCKKEFGASTFFINPANEEDNYALSQKLSRTTWINFNDLDQDGAWGPWNTGRFTDLLTNPRGAQGNLSGWQFSNASKWSIETANGKTNFSINRGAAPSGTPDTRTQTIDLIQKGWTPQELDTKPVIFIEQHYKINPGDTINTCLTIELLGASDNVLHTWGDGIQNCLSQMINSGSQPQIFPLSARLVDYPAGVRKIRWKDTISQAGRLGLGNALVGLYRDDTAPQALRTLAQTSSAPFEAKSLDSISLTLTSGDDGTLQSPYLNLQGLVSDYWLHHWFQFMEAHAVQTFSIYGYPKSRLEDKEYRGSIYLEGQWIGSDGWDLARLTLKFNNIVVHDVTPNVKLWPYNYFTGNGGWFYHFSFRLPNELRVQAIEEVATAKATIENTLAQANGLTQYALSKSEVAELLSIYDRYKVLYDQYQYDAVRLAELKQDANREYLQRIAYFQFDKIWPTYASRLISSNEITQFSQFKAKFENDVVLVDRSVEQYIELANDLKADIAGEFGRLVHHRICQQSEEPCTDKVTPYEIHQALFWSDLVYQEQSVIDTRIVDGLDGNNIYASGTLSYIDQDGSWGDQSSRAFLAVLNRQDNLKDIVIAFRGTYSGGDLATDLNFFLTTHHSFPGSNLMVHRGFQNMWQYHQENLTNELDRMLLGHQLDNVKTIYVVGHSLGAGVATISTPYIAHHLESHYGLKDRSRLKLITFGSPRTGNLPWVDHVDSMDEYFSSARVWNYKDFFPSVPWEMQGFAHVDSSIVLPLVAPGPGAVWPVNWFSKEYAGDVMNWMYEKFGSWAQGKPLEGSDIKSHGTDAYKFNVDRHLITLPIAQERMVGPENCVAMLPDGSLSDEPCENQYPFLCEELLTISLNPGVGENSVAWTNNWSISTNVERWSQYQGVCSGNKIFSVPSRSSDLDKINALLNGRTVWVNYIRKPVH